MMFDDETIKIELTRFTLRLLVLVGVVGGLFGAGVLVGMYCR